MTDEFDGFTSLVNEAIRKSGLNAAQAAAALAGCYVTAAADAWGARRAAERTYLLSLKLAERAGMTGFPDAVH